MQKSIIHDQAFLQQPSSPATASDVGVGQDLADTLRAHHDDCVGLAANMIGAQKRVIVVAMGQLPLVMFNPQITAASAPYQTQEGCLSLAGERSTKRFKQITVAWQDAQMASHQQTFNGFIAQIIQHEVDHCNGILI